MAEVLSKASLKTTKPRKRKIPAIFIKETIDGIPFYYKGYRSVLNKTKKLEDIMADSGLQTDIKSYLFGQLQGLSRKIYKVYVGGVGSHLDHRTNLGLDLAVYDRKVLTPDKITTKYIDVTPKLVIEIDVNVEVQEKNG